MHYNLIYFAFIGSNLGGVEQKILGQFDALFRLRGSVRLCLASSLPPDERLYRELSLRPNVSLFTSSGRGVFKAYTRRKVKLDFFASKLKEYRPEDTICYFRYPGADFLFLNFIRTNSRYRIITEHQQIENTFYKWKFNGNYLGNFLEMLLGRAIRRKLYGFVGVTEEITEYETKICRKPHKPSITIGNGINTNLYPVRHPNTNNPESIKLLFIGSGYGSHGLARLFKSLSDYLIRGNSEYAIQLKIIGNSQEMSKNKIAVEKLNLTKFVTFIDTIEFDQLSEYYDWADIAIGSLGLHRIGLTSSSTLKVREYICRGIPYISSSRDTDVPENWQYVLLFQDNDELLKIEDVIGFVIATRHEKEHPKQMHAFAEKYLEWSVKMKKLDDFFLSMHKP